MNLILPVALAELEDGGSPFLCLTTLHVSSQPPLVAIPSLHCGDLSYFGAFLMAFSLSVGGRPIPPCSLSVLSLLPFLRPLRIILAEDFYKKLKANLKPQEKQTKSLKIQTSRLRLI